MNGFDDQNYASALKCYIPDDVKLQKEALIIFCTAMNDLLANFVDAIVRNSDKMREINTKTVRESIKLLFPDRLRKLAFANASRNVVLYHSELISCDEENIAVGLVTTDYRNDIKRILKDFSFSAARRFMPHINGHLNDVCHAIAEKSSQNAHHNRVLAEDSVLSAVGEILPDNLKHLAVARIHYLQQHLVLPTASSSKEQEPLFAENQMVSVENESLDIEEVEHKSPKNASLHGKAHQLFKPVREKKQMVEKEYTPTKLTEEPEFLLAGKEMASTVKESLDTEEASTEFIEQSESLVDIDKIDSLHDITNCLYYPIGVKSRTAENEENKVVTIDEMREEDTKSRSFLDVARQWLFPTDKSPAEETESESSLSNKTVVK